MRSWLTAVDMWRQGCKSALSPAVSACLAGVSDVRPSLPYISREGSALANSHNPGDWSVIPMSPSKGSWGRIEASCRGINNIVVVTSRSIDPTGLETPPYSKQLQVLRRWSQTWVPSYFYNSILTGYGAAVSMVLNGNIYIYLLYIKYIIYINKYYIYILLKLMWLEVRHASFRWEATLCSQHHVLVQLPRYRTDHCDSLLYSKGPHWSLVTHTWLLTVQSNSRV